MHAKIYRESGQLADDDPISKIFEPSRRPPATGAIKIVGQERGQVVRRNLGNITEADNLSALPFAGINRQD